ncbi:tyrosine-protein phosphatase [Pedobacter heparinus]|uniref:protein-tyrosine-phosphatase n=1 Tax=Pedobacter heparinus (strain ATCC 13125 / DSM 2366 / CIP 104194 / JCM 7457 / NBRC 12017 / NCIMB 9290 / NRRL B-14731 / HIM 762-3) TaxID=485917 RepID=C6XVK4_PEDHD|nr:CpsB/CapC family capsule biosynthesis tyrosine phosphatase [Pedobacter heparinus]ACU06079.1 capsular polysaccharide biosynthesis protein [Pedobacter heparinus DSM 2366]
MFSFFKKNTGIRDVEWLGVDMHTHLLPGIDDGAKNVADTVGLIKGLKELGFSQFFCTPHIFTELYPNTAETIDAALTITTTALTKAGVQVKIDAAAEYMVDETFKPATNLLSLPGRHVLIEMSYLSEMPAIEQVIFDLQIMGHKVILAHPERYGYYHKKPDRYLRLKDMGVLFQLNLLSLSGYYGKEIKQVAGYLLQKKFYDFAGTDLHHHQHLDELRRMVRSGSLHQTIGNYPFKNKALI